MLLVFFFCYRTSSAQNNKTIKSVQFTNTTLKICVYIQHTKPERIVMFVIYTGVVFVAAVRVMCVSNSNKSKRKSILKIIFSLFLLPRRSSNRVFITLITRINTDDRFRTTDWIARPRNSFVKLKYLFISSDALRTYAQYSHNAISYIQDRRQRKPCWRSPRASYIL